VEVHQGEVSDMALKALEEARAKFQRACAEGRVLFIEDDIYNSDNGQAVSPMPIEEQKSWLASIRRGMQECSMPDDIGRARKEFEKLFGYAPSV
jgi:hypothetical protein